MATKASITKKLGRVRPPRVHITYDVETGGAIEKREIPFVIGVMADLSGQPEKPLSALKERKFIEIDRDNFDKVMAAQAPRVAFKVNNTLTAKGGKFGVDLSFERLADFEPQNVAGQVDALKQLMELRTKLANLRGSLYSNDKLDQLLQDAISETEALRNKAAAASSPEGSETEGE